MNQTEAGILITRKLGSDVLAGGGAPEFGFHREAEALARFAQGAIEAKDLRLLKEVCDVVETLLASTDEAIKSGLYQSFFPLLIFRSDGQAWSWLPSRIHSEWCRCRVDNEPGFEDEVRLIQELQAGRESLEILAPLRSFDFPMLVSADGELRVAKGMAELGRVLLKVFPAVGSAEQITLLDRDGDAFGVYLEDGQAIIHPQFLIRRWTKAQFVDLYNASKNARRLGVQYNPGSLSNKKRDRLIRDVCTLVLKEKEFMKQLSEATPDKKAARKLPFTNKQGQYLAFIHGYTKIHGEAPAEADIQRYFGVTPPTVHQMILRLAEKGLISRVPGQARSILVLVDAEDVPKLE